VDPRGLMAALVRSLKHAESRLHNGAPATRIVKSKRRLRVHTGRTKYLAAAW